MDLLKKLGRQLPALLGLALLVGAVYVVWKEFRHLKIADIRAALAAIPPRALLISFGWTILSYWVLTFYDRLGTIYAGHKVSYARVSFASFCAYSLSHNLGFAAVSGAAVRYRLYAHWGMTPFQIAKVVAFCSLTFTLGGLVLGGAILFFEPEAIPFFGPIVPRWVMYLIGAAMWAVVLAYVSLSRFIGTLSLFGHEVSLPDWRMALVQVTLASVDVAVTAAIFYALLPDAPGLTFLRFLGIYVASYTAGLAANLPGGIGVFDTAMLLGLESYLQPAQILGAIVVFRLYYYIIPLFLAGALFAGNEIMLRGGDLLRGRKGAPSRGAGARWNEPGLAVVAATAVVALCGALLMAMGLLDRGPDFYWIDPDFATYAALAGDFIPSLIGAALVVLAIGLSRRVTLAWGATLALLLVAASYTVVEGSPWWMTAALLLAALFVAPFRRLFYRRARLLSGPLTASTVLPLFALVGCLIALVAFQPRVSELTGGSWLEVVLSPDVPGAVRLSVALAVLLALLALWRLVRPGKVDWLPWAGEGRQRYAALGGALPAQADGVVMGEAGEAGIAFRRVGPVLLGLGDPVGLGGDRASAIWRLRDLARQQGLDPAVWRAGRGLLEVYSGLGLTALPLGRDGLPLPEQEGDTPAVDHYLCCVAERDSAVLLPLLPELSGMPLKNAAE